MRVSIRELFSSHLTHGHRLLPILKNHGWKSVPFCSFLAKKKKKTTHHEDQILAVSLER